MAPHSDVPTIFKPAHLNPILELMHVSDRLSTGVQELDAHLGGGLLPGTLTVVAGATGIGKTQLGLDFLNAGLEQEGRRARDS